MTDATRADSGGPTEGRTPGHRSDEVDVVPLHTPRSWWTWILLLTGPVTWATHFMVVYLFVDALCAAVTTADGGVPTWLGTSTPVAVTLVGTAIAAVVVIADLLFTARRFRQATREARREHQDATDIDSQLVRDRHILFVGCLLSALSLVSILLVGLSALWVPTC